MIGSIEENKDVVDVEEEIVIQEEAEKIKERVASEHNELYSQEMEAIRLKCQGARPNFSSNRISYDPRVFQEFGFKVINQFNGYEIVELEARIGGFAIPLKILSSHRRSPMSGFSSFSEGSFGKLFEVDFFGERVAIKSL
jgi:hypothetical protein